PPRHRPPASPRHGHQGTTPSSGHRPGHWSSVISAIVGPNDIGGDKQPPRKPRLYENATVDSRKGTGVGMMPWPSITLDPATLAQLDALARRLGIQAVGDDREAKRRGEVVRRLLMCWEASEQRRAW